MSRHRSRRSVPDDGLFDLLDQGEVGRTKLLLSFVLVPEGASEHEGLHGIAFVAADMQDCPGRHYGAIPVETEVARSHTTECTCPIGGLGLGEFGGVRGPTYWVGDPFLRRQRRLLSGTSRQQQEG